MGKSAITLLLLSATFGCASEKTVESGQTSYPHLAGLPLGPYTVGFHNFYLSDEDRPMPETGEPRQIQVVVWYPAAAFEKARMSYRKYFVLDAVGQGSHPPDERTLAENLNQVKKTLLERGMTPANFEKLLDLETAALENAVPQGQEFPVVFLSPGNRRYPTSYIGMVEYLASHGYVVISKPSSRVIDPNSNVDDAIIEGKMAIAAVQRLSLGAGEEFALIGASRCGTCIVIWQARESSAKALISLDGADGFGDSVINYFADNQLSAEMIRVPYAYLASDRNFAAVYGWRSNLSFVNDMMRADDRYHVTFSDFRHVDLTSSNGLLEFTIPGVSSQGMGSMRLATPERHHYTFRYVLNFLDAYMKGDEGAKRFLCEAAEAAGIPPGEVTIASNMCDAGS